MLFLIPVLFLLTSCQSSQEINIEEFKKKYNDFYKQEIFLSDDTITIEKENEYIIYWTPSDKNLCCSFYIDTLSGKIKRYTVSTDVYSREFKEFNDDFKKILNSYNQHITIKQFNTDNLYLVTYDDIRYSEENNRPTLKSDVVINNNTDKIISDN